MTSQHEMMTRLQRFEQQFNQRMEAHKANLAWLQADNERREAELKKSQEEIDKKYNYVPQLEPEIKPMLELTPNEFMESYKKHGESFANHIVKKIESSPEYQEIRSQSPTEHQKVKREPKNLSPEQILQQMKSGDLNELLSDLGA